MTGKPGNKRKAPKATVAADTNPGVDPGRDVLIALGAIIWTPNDAQPAVWQELAKKEGGTVDATVNAAAHAQMTRVLNRIGRAGATKTVKNALVDATKMLPDGP